MMAEEATSQQSSSSSHSSSSHSNIPLKSDSGFRISALNPKYLHTNSTSHTWPFSAVAELVDNAYDPDVKASQLYIDMKPFMGNNNSNKYFTLTFTDNGNGMIPDKVYKMLSFGFCEKVSVKGHMPVGYYGNGFKSGSMRLGKDALVFTKHCETRTLGFLSQTFLTAIKADTIVLPIVTWCNKSNAILNKEDKHSLDTILKYSILKTLDQIELEFDQIKSDTGTRIVISNLRVTQSGASEFEFSYEKHDILIPDTASVEESQYKREERQHHVPTSDYSLRSYLSILYLKPKMQIYLLGQKIKTLVVSKSLSKTEVDLYRPTNCKKPMKITFGFSQNINHYGIMMYYRNRLIKPYVRVGHQLKANDMGVGVIGVIECNALQPTHNKQDFNYTQLYRMTMMNLGMKLNEYWNEKCGNSTTDTEVNKNIKNSPDELWVQCDKPKCLKWRKLPDWVEKGDLPDKWYCYMHPDSSWSNCDIAEEEEESEEVVKPYIKKRKRQEREQRANQRLNQLQRETVLLNERRRLESHLGSLIQQQPAQIITTPTSSFTHANNRIVTPNQVTGMLPRHLLRPSSIPGPSPGPSSMPMNFPNHMRPKASQPFISPNVYAAPSPMPFISDVKSLNNTTNTSKHKPIAIIKEEVNEPQQARLNSYQTVSESGTRKQPITLESSSDEDEKKETGESKAKKPRIIKCDNQKVENSSKSLSELSGTDKKGQISEKTLIRDSSSSGSTELKGAIKISSKDLEGIDVDIIETLEQQTAHSLGMLVAKRSQSLKNLKRNIYVFIKTLIKDIDLPEYSENDIDDSTVEDVLHSVIQANLECNEQED